MTEAEENFAYWTEAYATDLMNGRDPCEFGMRWMAHQIREWRETAEAEREIAAREAEQQRYLQEQAYDPNWSQVHTTKAPYW